MKKGFISMSIVYTFLLTFILLLLLLLSIYTQKSRLVDSITSEAKNQIKGFVDTASAPEQPTPQFLSVSAGAWFSFALAWDGKLWGWGENFYSVLGDSISEDDCILLPAPMETDIIFSNIKASGGVVYAIGSRNGVESLYSWGDTSGGKLGRVYPQTVRSEPVPTEISYPEGVSKWLSVASGDQFGLALGDDGNIYSWGDNTHGQLGIGIEGSKYSSLQKVIKPQEVTKWIAVSASSSSNAAAIDSNHNIYTWGHNYYGYLGDGTTINRSVPVKIPVEDENGNKVNFRSIVSGSYLTMAISDENDLYSWGSGGGQVGDTTTNDIMFPTQINNISGSGINGKKISKVSLRGGSSLAIDTDGNLYSWGRNQSGALGNCTGTIQFLIPTQINNINGSDINGKKILDVSTSGSHSLAIDTDGNLYGWGSNSYGQLGNGIKTYDKYECPIKIEID